MELTVACLTDTHGALAALGRAATLLAELRRGGGSVLLLDNGDTIQGTPTVHYYSRESALAADHPVVRALGLLGCDFAVPGNHDFDYGVDVIETVVTSSPFPWLAANLERRSPIRSPFLPYAVKEVGSLKIGVVGATTRVPMWKDPLKIRPYELLDEVEAVRRAVEHLRGRMGVDFVIVSYHGGLGDETSAIERGENQGRRMIASVEGIDLLVAGHEHSFSVEEIGTTLVVQAGSGGRAIGCVSLRFDADPATGEWRCNRKEATLVDLAAHDPDPEFMEHLSVYERRAREWLEHPLCTLSAKRIFDDFFTEVCLGEHDWVQWMHDVQKNATDCEISAVAIKNPDFIETDMAVLRTRDVLDFFPYPDNLCVTLLTGEQIIAALEVTASFFARDENGDLAVDAGWREPHLLVYQYLMWDGIDYEIDVDRPPGRRISSATIQGKPVELAAAYPVVMTQYFKNASSKYRLLHDAPIIWRNERDFSDLLIEDAARRRVFDVRADLNWSVRR